MLRQLFCNHKWEYLKGMKITDEEGFYKRTEYYYICKKCLKKKKVKY